MDRRFYGVDWGYVDIEWSGVEGISEFCETEKGGFFYLLSHEDTDRQSFVDR